MRIVATSFEVFLLFVVVYSIQGKDYGKCPMKINSVSNDFNVVGRFNKMVDDIDDILSVTDIDKKDEYKYTITFCGGNGAAVLQKKLNPTATDSKKPVDCGKFANSTLVGGEDWMFLQYRAGDRYGSHCHQAERETWINIRCEENGEEPKLKLIEEANYEHSKHSKVSKCFYLFEFNHPAVCVPRKKKLSGGAVFMIILVSLFSAYLLFGFLYQRFVAHAKGFEQIPNFAFWKKVGNMSADGCDFFCRREEESNTYKGMADALDIESSDDERDDGLLPM